MRARDSMGQKYGLGGWGDGRDDGGGRWRRVEEQQEGINDKANERRGSATQAAVQNQWFQQSSPTGGRTGKARHHTGDHPAFLSLSLSLND